MVLLINDDDYDIAYYDIVCQHYVLLSSRLFYRRVVVVWRFKWTLHVRVVAYSTMWV